MHDWKPYMGRIRAQICMANRSNLERVREIFGDEATRRGLKCALGVASFRMVYDELLPVQQKLLEEASGERFTSLMETGSVISIAFAYPEHAIDVIGEKTEGGYDKEKWNFYAEEYMRLNNALDETAVILADEIGGIALPATVMDKASEIRHVEDYYTMAVSHRVAAEQSGVGWRGKNELVVNPVFSCAIRLASVVTETTLERTPAIGKGCGDCRACLDACPILGSKDRLDNYREHCMRYIVSLGLDSDVCGKCIKACYRNGIYGDRFRL
jgi:epoxyqueuosine reductase QueG